MTPDVGPRICDACKWEFHDLCQIDDFCECLVTFCYERWVEL